MFDFFRAAVCAPTRTAYDASKAEMIGMAWTWVLELTRHGQRGRTRPGFAGLILDLRVVMQQGPELLSMRTEQSAAEAEALRTRSRDRGRGPFVSLEENRSTTGATFERKKGLGAWASGAGF